jgi:hypothetical protein
MSFYRRKDTAYVFYNIRTPPCWFSLRDEFVLPRKWWRVEGGAAVNLGFSYMVVPTG